MADNPVPVNVDEEITLASEEKRGQWLQRRLRVYCIVSMAAVGVEILVHVVAMLAKRGPFVENVLAMSAANLLPGLITLLVFGVGYLRAGSRPLDRGAVIRYSFWIVVLVGVIAFFVRPVFAAFPLRAVMSGGAVRDATEQPSFFGRLLMIHLIGSLFLPWTAREAFKVLLGLSGLAVLSNLLFVQDTLGHRVFEILLLPLAGVPGLLFCRFRHSRFRSKFTIEHLVRRYGRLQLELEQARRIHEMLFPNEMTEGPFQLRYRYEPLQQIGGDYLFVHRDAADRLNLVVLDVTGHGITAALTVNRIDGELDRLFGENDDRSPGGVLEALSRYFCVSLARHGIFATAAAVRIDQKDERLEWANAGHPPPFVLDAQGGCVLLDPHAVMLGVLDEPAYECATQTRPFSDTDRVVLYTDGVIEAHDRRFEMLGLDRFEQVLRERAGRDSREPVSEQLLREVQRFRSGPAEDDILIVELTRNRVN
jgi:sigma-B regulation protein RsbU (phosphoserine phosphatase)